MNLPLRESSPRIGHSGTGLLFGLLTFLQRVDKLVKMGSLYPARGKGIPMTDLLVVFIIIELLWLSYLLWEILRAVEHGSNRVHQEVKELRLGSRARIGDISKGRQGGDHSDMALVRVGRRSRGVQKIAGGTPGSKQRNKLEEQVEGSQDDNNAE